MFARSRRRLGGALIALAVLGPVLPSLASPQAQSRLASVDGNDFSWPQCAKGVGNGYALGGVVARADVMDCLTATSFNTFGGNPIASTAGSAVIDYILDHDLQANAAGVGAILHEGLRKAAESLPKVAEIRGRGLMIAVEFAEPGTLAPDPAAALRVVEECKAGGLLVGKGGLYGNVIRMGPPLTLTEAEARHGLAILIDALRKVA